MDGEDHVESVLIEVEVDKKKKPCCLSPKNGVRLYLSVMLSFLVVLAIIILKFSTSRWGKVASDCLRMVVNASDTELDDHLLERVDSSVWLEISYLLPNGTWM